MDTGTHVVMGLALGGIATLDPVVAMDPITAKSIVIGTLIGSQAPDLDTALKLRNNAKYIRNHRGITHSIPAVLLWPILITGGIYFFLPEVSLLHLWMWTFIAVILHVFVDIFNAYGTQALRPFSKKWIALGVINTFDPFIFFMHIVGLIIWGYGAHPGYTFLLIYGVLIVYYLLRFAARRKVHNHILEKIPEATEIIISPTFRFHNWHVAVTTNTHFYVAKSKDHEITIHDVFEKCPIPDTPVINKARKDENISAFLSFSPVYRWEVDEYTDHYEVRFIDLRYRSKGYYPFVAIVQLDQDLNIISSYTGWIFSEEKLRRKLELLPS
ncbi:metal-dependent hydrolase [Bacillus sp. PS06]|uniref:metal-dependent hydrolase n=1 Tax=Bacillus sp. PS06 TaxID=2764176 RepID=UPI0017877945|nr:metal-dependent hydrolase [Bacillus sp. PS06]MBD8071213.1 metal-dependent hydrolase [Bacillus sp. PS06]